MGRPRISMKLIHNERSRRTTFEKRKKGLLKKAYEFSTLCGVDACVIIYDGERVGGEPETWPKEETEVSRIIQKYHNTTIDKRPKVYGLQEYFDDKIKKVEGEISKVCKDKLKIMYPDWDDSFNTLREDQLRSFISILDAKLDACNQRINKGKTIAAAADQSVIMASEPSCYLNLMQQQNLNSMTCPLQFGQSSQPSMLDFSQNYYMPLVPWANQFDYPTSGMLKEDGAENNQSFFTPYYYNNGNIQQNSLGDAPSLPSHQNLHHDQVAACPTLSYDNGFYDPGLLQPQIFNNMQQHGRN